jgi:lysophospholipase L1-like esterase
MHGTDYLRTGVTLIAAMAVTIVHAQTNTPAPAATNTPPAVASPAGPPLRILLLGDSTAAGTCPRMVAPKADHLEDVIRKLLAAEPDLPPTEVIDRGVNGATVKTLLENYDAWIGKLPGPCDYIFMRFGVNDVRSGTNFPTEFPVLYHQLLERLHKDHPQALLTLETTIPYKGGDLIVKANDAVRKIAETEKLPLVDIYTRFSKELALQGPNALTYRYVAWEDIPAGKRSLVPDAWRVADGKYVVILDNTLDAHFRELPRWFADRHPNLAGYHVIGDEIARYLVPVIRERIKGQSSSVK